MAFKKVGVINGLIILAIIEVALLLKGLLELAYYNALLVLIFLIILFIGSRFKVPGVYLSGLVFVGALNALGGIIFVKGVRLYDVYFGFFKIDMLIHLLALFFGTLIVYSILERGLKNYNASSRILICSLIAFAIGALFEVLEFLGVVLLKNQGVGDYLNNALDLVFNLIGVVLGSLWIWIRK